MTQYSLDVNLNLPQTPKSDNIPPEEWSEFLRIYNAIRTLAAYSNQLAQAIAGGGGGGSSSSSTTFGAMQQFLDSLDQEAPLLIPGPVGAASTVPGPAGPAGQSIRGLDGEDGENGLSIPGNPGIQGPQGNTGPAGVSIRGLDGEDGIDGLPIPGNTGQQGLQGIQGFPGSNIIIYDGDDGIDGLPIPGNKGDQGIQGIQGVAGTPGANIVIYDGEAGDDGLTIPGNKGADGAQGGIGPVGPPGVSIFRDWGEDGIDGIPMPGNPGANGKTWYAVTTNPNGSLFATNGDLAFNINTGDTYLCLGGTLWAQQVSLMGPRGFTGFPVPGNDGEDGDINTRPPGIPQALNNILGYPGMMPNLKYIAGFGSNLAIGTTDMYTVPTSRRAVIGASVRAYNASAGSIPFSIKLKVSGVYFRLIADVTSGTGAAAFGNLVSPILLNAGESLSCVTTTNAGLNVRFDVYEFDANDDHIVGIRNTAFPTGTNTLYTVPAGRTFAPLAPSTINNTCPAFSQGYVATFNDTGASITYTPYVVPSGGTAGTTNQFAAAFALGNLTLNAFAMLPTLNSGDFIAINASAANLIVWGVGVLLP